MYSLRVLLKRSEAEKRLASFFLRSNQVSHLLSVDVNCTPRCDDILNAITTPPPGYSEVPVGCPCPTQTASQFKDSINCLPRHLSSLCSFTQPVSI
jgi:hypothetical protein